MPDPRKTYQQSPAPQSSMPDPGRSMAPPGFALQARNAPLQLNDDDTMPKPRKEHLFGGKPSKPTAVRRGTIAGKDNARNYEFHAEDVVQGEIDDCWLMSGLMAVAESHPALIQNAIRPDGVADGNGKRKFIVTLYKPKSFSKGMTRKEIAVTNEFFVNYNPGLNRQEKDTYARTAQTVDDANDNDIVLWVRLIEKAAAKMLGGYRKLDFQPLNLAFKLLTGQAQDRVKAIGTGKGQFAGDGLKGEIRAAIDSNEAVLAGSRNQKEILRGDQSYTVGNVAMSEAYSISEKHAYMVRRADNNGITLRNPLGDRVTQPEFTLTWQQFEAYFFKFHRANL